MRDRSSLSIVDEYISRPEAVGVTYPFHGVWGSSDPFLMPRYRSPFQRSLGLNIYFRFSKENKTSIRKKKKANLEVRQSRRPEEEDPPKKIMNGGKKTDTYD